MPQCGLGQRPATSTASIGGQLAASVMLPFKKVSIIIPVHNEEKTLGELLRLVCAVDLSSLSIEKEIIVLDDGSTDNSLLYIPAHTGSWKSNESGGTCQTL
jgi:cellulose synthase/poly-beta-1,6-N-acetylglucosamine synthase-like glycosyltransferase